VIVKGEINSPFLANLYIMFSSYLKARPAHREIDYLHSLVPSIMGAEFIFPLHCRLLATMLTKLKLYLEDMPAFTLRFERMLFVTELFDGSLPCQVTDWADYSCRIIFDYRC